MKQVIMGMFFLILSGPLFALSDISKLMTEEADLFNCDQDTYIKHHEPMQVFWLSKEKKTCRYADERTMKKISFYELKVWEIVTDFEEGKVSQVTISLYNRGDAGDMAIDPFEELVKAAKKKLDDWAGDDGTKGRRKSLPKSRGYIYSHSWKGNGIAVAMQWGKSKKEIKGEKTYAGEYLKLTMLPDDGKKRYGDSLTQTKTTASRSKLSDNVLKKENGDVYIDGIPMVDQGLKGYCAVCVTSRILKYYGSDVGQNTIAQLAETRTQGGTSSQKLIEGLKRSGGRYGLTVKEYKGWDYKDFQKLVKNYNRLAKKAEKPQFSDRDVSGFLDRVDPEIYKELKVKKMRSEYSKFLKYVKSNIDNGVPVVWGVTLGIFPEKERNNQSRGGHLRLIIGYNNKDKTIIFSDTWGARHVFKTMSQDNAWAMTNEYYAFLPRNL